MAAEKTSLYISPPIHGRRLRPEGISVPLKSSLNSPDGIIARAAGFTLLEVLVSMAIFAILGVLAYGGYNNSAQQSAMARESMARLEEVQTAIRLLTQDFTQLAHRPVRDVLGDSLLPSIQSDENSDTVVVLTRSGWTNPAGLPRPALQRVAYVLEEQALRRDHWTVLDATLANEVIQRPLLEGVESLQLRYMDQNRQWQAQWPPLGMPPAIASRARPIAVEVTLELEDYGEIIRLIEVGG
jgi:general secretion pathway protein J